VNTNDLDQLFVMLRGQVLRLGQSHGSYRHLLTTDPAVVAASSDIATWEFRDEIRRKRVWYTLLNERIARELSVVRQVSWRGLLVYLVGPRERDSTRVLEVTTTGTEIGLWEPSRAFDEKVRLMISAGWERAIDERCAWYISAPLTEFTMKCESFHSRGGS
jgi:hypothetical protein